MVINHGSVSTMVKPGYYGTYVTIERGFTMYQITTVEIPYYL